MNIPIGFQLYGKTKAFANQYMVTDFFCFGIPLWPVCSYFVNEESGLKIKLPLNRASLVVFYFGGTFIWLGAILFGTGFMIANTLRENVNLPYIEFMPFVLSITLIAIGIYHYFVGAKSSRAEVRKRTILQMSTGLNALPEWLGTHEASQVLALLKANNAPNWKQKIKEQSYASEDFYSLYSLIIYESYLNPGAENEALRDHLDKKFVKN